MLYLGWAHLLSLFICLISICSYHWLFIYSLQIDISTFVPAQILSHPIKQIGSDMLNIVISFE